MFWKKSPEIEAVGFCPFIDALRDFFSMLDLMQSCFDANF